MLYLKKTIVIIGKKNIKHANMCTSEIFCLGYIKKIDKSVFNSQDHGVIRKVSYLLLYGISRLNLT